MEFLFHVNMWNVLSINTVLSYMYKYSIKLHETKTTWSCMLLFFNTWFLEIEHLNHLNGGLWRTRTCMTKGIPILHRTKWMNFWSRGTHATKTEKLFNRSYFLVHWSNWNGYITFPVNTLNSAHSGNVWQCFTNYSSLTLSLDTSCSPIFNCRCVFTKMLLQGWCMHEQGFLLWILHGVLTLRILLLNSIDLEIVPVQENMQLLHYIF